MSVSAAIADLRLRRAFGGQARRSFPRRTVQVRLGVSRLRMPVSRRDYAISRRTVMNNAGYKASLGHIHKVATVRQAAGRFAQTLTTIGDGGGPAILLTKR